MSTPCSTKSNPFSNPDYYRKSILQQNLIISDAKAYAGKSFMCVFFTRFCGVGCPFCFFKSAPVRNQIAVKDQFTEAGIDKFIEFCNQANLGYVLISGGGEPLSQKRAVLRTIAEVKTDRIVLVTSGNWALNKDAAKRYLAEIEAAISKREKPCVVCVRVSVSEGHAIKLGTHPACNLIEIFAEQYRSHPYLKFQIHAFENDSMLNKVLEKFEGHVVEIDTQRRASDDEQVIKIIPQKLNVTFTSGYKIVVGVSKIFGSDLRPNLNQVDTLKKTMATFDRDLEESEDNNSAVLYNSNGERGLDWSLNYNGNICTWQNQVNDNQWNIYEDSYQDILAKTFSDPITLSYIEKGCKYREKIVMECSPRAVLRLKSISLRDYSGTVLFEEEKTRLYYSIRVLQDYLKEGRVKLNELEKLPENLQTLIQGGQELAKTLYNSAKYTIIDQYKKLPFDPIKWRDLLELIKLGHYDLQPRDVQDALEFYNTNTTLKTYKSIDEVEHEKGEQIQLRLTERLMYMKPSAFSRSQHDTTADYEAQLVTV